MQTPDLTSRPDQTSQKPAHPTKPTPALIVSIHDVSPLTSERTAQILADLEVMGVREVSLLVVPNHHGKAPLMGNEGFRDWLQKEAQGREIVAHGFTHQRPPRVGDTPVSKLIHSFYTAGEGEFFDLDEGEALQRLKEGREWLAWCGFSPSGFIAPAWLLGEEALRAVRAAGFDYTTRLDRIEPLGPGRESLRSQSLVWSVRAPWRRQMSLVWNFCLAASLAHNPVLRVGIHPPDWEFPRIRQQILHLVRVALAHRAPMTYESWVRSAQS